MTLLKIKSNIGQQTCMCIHAAAYYFVLLGLKSDFKLISICILKSLWQNWKRKMSFFPPLPRFWPIGWLPCPWLLLHARPAAAGLASPKAQSRRTRVFSLRLADHPGPPIRVTIFLRIMFEPDTTAIAFSPPLLRALWRASQASPAS